MFAPLGDLSSLSPVQCLCLGSGRFLRAVLVPAMARVDFQVIVCQTRGSDFPDSILAAPKPEYEVDTVMEDGTVHTEAFRVAAVGTVGTAQGKEALLQLINHGELRGIRIIGFGVTEAGVVHDSQAINDLASVLHAFYASAHANHISVINTDNVPENGDKIGDFVRTCSFVTGRGDQLVFMQYLASNVTFHNTMVDRITSQRANDPLTPRAEPLPAKSLVIEDVQCVLPEVLRESPPPGLIVRSRREDMAMDRMLKLYIANATHTALVYAMAINRCGDTSSCVSEKLYIELIDQLIRYDIGILCRNGVDHAVFFQTYNDWRRRLLHPYFGLSTLFVCQNALQKLSIRLLPTIEACLVHHISPSPYMAFALASLLRFITPIGEQPTEVGVYKGAMDYYCQPTLCTPDTHIYAGTLKADFVEGWYEFRESGIWPIAISRIEQLQPMIRDRSGESYPVPHEGLFNDLIAQILSSPSDVSLDVKARNVFREFVGSVSAMYAKLISGTPNITLLREVIAEVGLARAPLARDRFVENLVTSNIIGSRYLTLEELQSVVIEEISNVEVIDLHTHLFPPSHSSLIKYGFDALLTYHYLVAEFFMSVSTDEPIQSYVLGEPLTPEYFFGLPLRVQADLIWEHLFVHRTPLSEAARGVCTTLKELGLGDALKRRDVATIRRYFDNLDAEEYVETVFRTAKVKYCVMTNVPFDEREAQYFKPVKAQHSARFRTALRVDPLLKNDWDLVSSCLAKNGYELSVEGAIAYLCDWAEIMEPEYLMASTPGDFKLFPPAGDGSSEKNLLEQVLVPVAEKCGLALVLKLEADRGWNPRLRDGGDGVRELDPKILQQLCTKYPRIKFMTTFLSRGSQHAACVLANKFPNLHLYGCWWYCNNPSIISEITKMRLEMLGTSFTAQHSDARVLDQLVYKWKHNRKVIGQVLLEQYVGLYDSGWAVTRDEVARDVHRLFGGAYEEFLAKKLA